MIKKSSSFNRFLRIALGITLGLAAALTVFLMVVPEKEDRSTESQGILLFQDGETKPCAVSLQGTVDTYAFDKDAPIYNGTLSVDGTQVNEVYLTFNGDYAAPKSDGASAVLSKDMEIAAQLTLDGKDCLLLAPAPDEAAAQTLLARFLAEVPFARKMAWETYQR